MSDEGKRVADQDGTQAAWEEKRRLIFERAGIPEDIVGKVIRVTHQWGDLEVFVNAANLCRDLINYNDICLTPAASFVRVRTPIGPNRKSGFNIGTHRVLRFSFIDKESYWTMVLERYPYQNVSLRVLS